MSVIQNQFHKALKINWCDDKIFFSLLIKSKVKCNAAMQLYWSLKNPGVGLNLCIDSDRQTVHIELNCTAFHLQLHNFPMHWIFSPWKNQISTLDNLVITPLWALSRAERHDMPDISILYIIYYILYTNQPGDPDDSQTRHCSPVQPHCRAQPQPSPHLSPSLSLSGHSNSAVNAAHCHTKCNNFIFKRKTSWLQKCRSYRPRLKF